VIVRIEEERWRRVGQYRGGAEDPPVPWHDLLPGGPHALPEAAQTIRLTTTLALDTAAEAKELAAVIESHGLEARGGNLASASVPDARGYVVIEQTQVAA
jgi:hypothetical protein